MFDLWTILNLVHKRRLVVAEIGFTLFDFKFSKWGYVISYIISKVVCLQISTCDFWINCSKCTDFCEKWHFVSALLCKKNCQKFRLSHTVGVLMMGCQVIRNAAHYTILLPILNFFKNLTLWQILPSVGWWIFGQWSLRSKWAPQGATICGTNFSAQNKDLHLQSSPRQYFKWLVHFSTLYLLKKWLNSKKYT